MKPAPKSTYPLGYIELPDGAKPIFPMNNLFLNYMFQTAEHWEALRTLVNILIETYAQHKPDTTLTTIKGIKDVTTQFKHLLNTQNVTRDQDIKITDANDDFMYIEFQNRAKPDVPIELRSVQYFALGIGHGKGKLANQIWLLAENVEPLMHGKTFARYILKDEITGTEHPRSSGIFYISLPKLAEEDSPAGELARFLLGRITDAASDDVKQVTNSFNTSFGKFKAEKEVPSMLSLHERGVEEGRAEGMEKGLEKGIEQGMEQGMEKGMEKGIFVGAAKLAELIKNGLSVEDALRKLGEGQQELAESN